VEVSAPVCERVEYADLLHVEQIDRREQRLLQRREWTRWRVYDSKLLRSEHGARSLVLRHSALPFLGHRLRAAAWQRQTLVQKRTGLVDFGQLANELHHAGTF